jgi:hypothetical protein
MKAKRILKVIPVTTVCVLTSFSPCFAARIYNKTPTPIYVHGRGGVFTPENTVVVDPGQRSKSLEWRGNNHVFVYEGSTLKLSKEICFLDFGLHHQMVGGNYMVVRKEGDSFRCVVCDTKHSPLAGSGSCQ